MFEPGVWAWMAGRGGLSHRGSRVQVSPAECYLLMLPLLLLLRHKAQKQGWRGIGDGQFLCCVRLHNGGDGR